MKVRTRRWSGEEIAKKKVSAHGIEKQLEGEARREQRQGALK